MENRCRDEEDEIETLVIFFDVGLLVLFASQMLLVLMVWDASNMSVTLSVLLVLRFFTGFVFPLQSKGAEHGSPAPLGHGSSACTTSIGDWPLSLNGTLSLCMTAAWAWPDSLREGVEAWLVSVSSVSWADEGEELQGDDGQQESHEQLV